MINFNKLKRHDFPDGMSYREIDKIEDKADIIASLRSFQDLMELAQLVDYLRFYGCKEFNLVLHYLIGSRMDRDYMGDCPNTLRVVCDTINSMNFDHISVVWPHSEATMIRLNAHESHLSEICFIRDGILKFIDHSKQDPPPSELDMSLILPDAGAAKRYWTNHNKILGIDLDVVECNKIRDVATGQLTDFIVPRSVKEKCIIVDDLCDGGGTFSGLATKLKKNGAKEIGLVVYHGVFSKGQQLDNIDFTYTTNSFRELEFTPNFYIKQVI